METTTELKTYPVIGLKYPHPWGPDHELTREVSFDSLEECYGHLIEEDLDFRAGMDPSGFMIEDGSIIPFHSYLFHCAFAKGRLSEEDLVQELRTRE